jgi:hypothetical protein
VKLRKPHMPIEEIMKGKAASIEQMPKNALVYTIEFMAHLAMSPLCLTVPNDWERISRDYPFLVRNVSDCGVLIFFVGVDGDFFCRRWRRSMPNSICPRARANPLAC